MNAQKLLLVLWTAGTHPRLGLLTSADPVSEESLKLADRRALSFIASPYVDADKKKELLAWVDIYESWTLIGS